MMLDASFWVAISFFIFIGILFYFKIPLKINSLLDNQIKEIQNEIEESEKLRIETQKILNDAQQKLESAKKESENIINEAKKNGDRMIIEMNEKFYKFSENKKNSTKIKISQMKNSAIKDIKNSAVNLALISVKKIIETTIDKSKLDDLFNSNLEETKKALKKVKS